MTEAAERWASFVKAIAVAAVGAAIDLLVSWLDSDDDKKEGT